MAAAVRLGVVNADHAFRTGSSQHRGDIPLSEADRAPETGKATPFWMLFTRRQRWTYLSVLFLVTTSNYFDFNVLSIVLQPIKDEFHVSDTMLGLLSGFVFASVYAVAGIPVARWADRGN